MKPDREGVWEWFDEDGTKRLVDVVNIERDEKRPKYLRVAFWGGYYNVHDEQIGTDEESWCKAEWPDRWGSYVGKKDEVNEDHVYLFPTEEILEKIRNQSK